MKPNAKSYLANMDLSYVIEFMCSDRYPLASWEVDDAKYLEMLYKRFLWLMIKYPERSFVPTKVIDEFWHNHILYTKKYHHDCDSLAGKYLHHTPSDPEQEDESEELSTNFELTQKLYEQEFGEALEVYVE